MIGEETLYTFENKYPLTWYEVDYQKILKPSALLNHLQDIATKSADKVGVGLSFTEPRHYAWFLLKYHLEFEDYPQNLDKITLKTEARGISRLFAIRDFEIWSEDKSKFLGRASTQWAMINLNDKSFVKIGEQGIFPPFEKREDDLSFPKVNQLDSYDSEKVFDVRYDDIDVNQHVNNANYIVWAFEALPLEFRKNHKPKTIDLVYKKDISYGNKVKSKIKIENDMTYHLLTNQENDEPLCVVSAQWQAL